MIISKRIFKLLKVKKISQKEFSEKTRISPSTISDWKRKKTNPEHFLNFDEAARNRILSYMYAIKKIS